MTDFSPALTRRQWLGNPALNASEIPDGGWEWDRWDGVVAHMNADPTCPALAGTKIGNEVVANPRHATAALCLYQQSFGFTHDDVWDLRKRCDAKPEWGVSTKDPCGICPLCQLASRIASLLPPQP